MVSSKDMFRQGENELERQIREQEAAFSEKEKAPAAAKPVKEEKPAAPKPEAPAGKAPAAAGLSRQQKGLIIWLALLAVLAATLAPRLLAKREAAGVENTDAEQVDLSSPMAQLYGSPQGPFKFASASAPDVLTLTNAAGQKLECKLIGLRAEPFPSPTPEPGELADAPADPQMVKDYLAGMLKTACEGKTLWVLPLGRQAPKPVYLFLGAGTAAPHGLTGLLNASLLRKGMAMLDPDDASQPFFEQMAECQRAALADYEARTAPGESVWYHFPMVFPKAKLPAAGGAPAAQ